jgi:hypothetical protein
VEYLFTFIVLGGSIFGLYFLIKKQINRNSQDNSKELESKLESFIEAFKLESAKKFSRSNQRFKARSKKYVRYA